jgi:hypothetical protein
MSLLERYTTRRVRLHALSPRKEHLGDVRRGEGCRPEPEPCAPSRRSSLGCRLIQTTLALYLLPALLIVLLVGVVGILVLSVVRFCTRLVGSTAS